jgi:hypothetical protein
MKQLFIAAMLCILGFAAKSQTVTNYTNCPIVIRAYCYDPITCTVNSFCGSVVVPGGITTVALPVCACPPGQDVGYRVCWAAPAACTPICTSVGDAAGPWPCAQFPSAAVLPNCGTCANVPGGARIIYDAAGNMHIR